MQLFRLILFIILGFGIASIFGIQDLQNTGWYLLFVASLLAIGLYASTYSIVLQEARQHFRIILSAVTIGVILKAAIIGGSLALIFQDPFFLILGITVAQIDPLSVAGLMKGSRMSAKAKTVLASWASFDDPITVIMALYTPLIVGQLFGADFGSITGNSNSSANLASYIQELGLNLGLAAQAFCLYTVIRYYSKHISAWIAAGVSIASYILLAIAFSVSLLYFMMLGIALIGLFLRPPKIDKVLDHAITWALRVAAVLLGLLLIGGINIWSGIALGVAAYCSQIIVGFLLTRRLPSKDRWHISFAQQNGITAIILALLFEPIHPGTVAIVAPAILVVNSLHAFVNKVLDKYVLHEKV
jgi:NhaP-type Na+/H+ or K+/H+ antiporter